MSVDPSQIQLNDDQRRLLATAADFTGLPWEIAFQQAVTPLLPATKPDANGSSPVETPYAKLARLGLIGCIEGTPPDLSTNKAHLEGLGRDG